MKMIGHTRITGRNRSTGLSGRSIAMLAVMGACALVIVPAHAQGTTASIFGHGPAGATVTARSTTGAERHTTIAKSGRYKLLSVPMGNYTVVLEKDEKAIDTRRNIQLTVGRGAQIDFACENDKCEAADS